MSFRKHAFSAEIRQALRPLHSRSNWHGLVAVMIDYVVIFAAVGLSVASPYFYPLSVLLIGSRQRALSALLHDAVHRLLARNRRLNSFLGSWLAGYAIFIDFDYYRDLHVVKHHVHLGDPERDPDQEDFRDFRLDQIEDRLDFLLRHLFKQCFLLGVPSYLKYLLTSRLIGMLKDPRQRYPLLLTQAVLAALLTWIAGPWAYLLFWVLPYVTVSQLFAWLNLISEHYRLFERGTTVLDITRNRFPAWWERLFYGLHNENYHLTHHLFPGIPFWNLGKAHRVLLADASYRAANQTFGGMFSAPKGRVSVVVTLLEDIRRYPAPAISSPSRTM